MILIFVMKIFSLETSYSDHKHTELKNWNPEERSKSRSLFIVLLYSVAEFWRSEFCRLVAVSPLQGIQINEIFALF